MNSSFKKIKLKLNNFFLFNNVKLDYSYLSIVKKDQHVILLYKDKKNDQVYCAKSCDGFNFNITDEKYTLPTTDNNFPNAKIIPNFYYNKRKIMFFGHRSINIASLNTNKKWEVGPKPLIISNSPLEVSNVFLQKQGLLLLYLNRKIENGFSNYYAYFALFDRKRPNKLLWQLEKPILETKTLWKKEALLIGSIFLNEKIICYWLVDSKIIYGVVLAGFKYNPEAILKNKLTKHSKNPIICPNPKNDWEAFNTFNPAAIYADKKIHILYRAQGFDYISSVGYASSKDGIKVDERLSKPIFYPTMDFETNSLKTVNYEFVSGGGFGGCEDPRITLIGNRIYMIYVAFNGWSPPRLTLTSILLNDFLNKRWLWTKPVLISPPGVADKSGCLMSEKINNKYVFFHRIFPNILIDFVDDLNFDGKSKFLKGQYKIEVRTDKWDSRKIGAGAPPLKTKDGWLLIYYGVDERNAGQYKIGAMLLDLKDPTKVLYRTDNPIIEPSKDYENTGFKPGVVYPCGAVIVKDQLLVYYGGADSVVCVAYAKLNSFLKNLKSNKTMHLNKLEIHELKCN